METMTSSIHRVTANLPRSLVERSPAEWEASFPNGDPMGVIRISTGASSMHAVLSSK